MPEVLLICWRVGTSLLSSCCPVAQPSFHLSILAVLHPMYACSDALSTQRLLSVTYEACDAPHSLFCAYAPVQMGKHGHAKILLDKQAPKT